jgi:hypoxanthine phosphoribosyltransferase
VNQLKVLYNAPAIAKRIRLLGGQISRDFRGQTLDVVGLVDNGFIFMADLVRSLTIPVRCHFVRTEIFDALDPSTGKPRKEIFYTPEINGAGRNILLVNGVLESGITTDFLLRRIGLSHPRMIKTAVFIDKPQDRKVPLHPDYHAFRVASNQIVAGYGLSWNGLHGNLPYLATWARKRPGRTEPAARVKPARRGHRRRRVRE